MALLRVAPVNGGMIEVEGRDQAGRAAAATRSAGPTHMRIAANAGLNGEAEVAKVAKGRNGQGLDARNGSSVDLVEAGIIDPVKVCYSAVRNAASVAEADLTDASGCEETGRYDPAVGPALGEGAELL